MEDYLIMADNMGDLPDDYCEKHQLRRLYLSYLMDGVTYNGENQMDEKEFYAKLRGGSLPTSSQPNPQQAKEFFESCIGVTDKILFIAVSSGISGTYGSIHQGAQEVMEEHPEMKIVVVDSLCASLGEGLLIHKAIMMKESGASFEEVVDWVEKYKLNVVHNFTVDDLFHLHRGGRVSKATAILGTMINIKPMLHVDNDGHLINIGKARGRKKSVLGLADAMQQQIGSWKDKNDVIFISHGDCYEDAQLLADTIKARMGFDSFLINYVGPTIGTHSGPGTLALFYMGDVR